MTRTPPVPKQSQSPGPRAPLKKQDAPEPAPVQTANIPLAPKDPSILETQVDNWEAPVAKSTAPVTQHRQVRAHVIDTRVSRNLFCK